MITDELSNAEYHALESISKSGLDLIAKSPAHFKAKARFIGSDAARIGTAAHSMILEDGKGLLTGIDRARRSAADKEAWDEWFLANGATTSIASSQPAANWFTVFENQSGNVIVTPAELKQLTAMRDSVISNTQARIILEEGKAEQSILFEHNGVDCRVRPDWITPTHIMADLKTCVDASYQAFRMSCAKYRYHVQAAMYSQGYVSEKKIWPDFRFIAVEKTAPYLCAVYQLDDTAMENGYWLFERDLATYKQCVESGEWPGYADSAEMSIPIFEEETFEIFIDGESVAA